MRPFLSATGEALDLALAKPRAVLALSALGLVGALVAALVSPVAGAIAVLLVFAALVATFIYALRQRALFDGPYEVLEDETVWDFRSNDGSEVWVTRRCRVRFNYPTMVLVDRSWGDGDVFAEYKPHFGEVVHRGADGSSEYVIIAMPAYRQRGEEVDLVTDRMIRNGFLGSREWIEYDLAKKAKKSILEIRWLDARAPTRVEVRRKTTGRTEDLTAQLVGGADQRVLRIADPSPPRGERYTITWTW